MVGGHRVHHYGGHGRMVFGGPVAELIANQARAGQQHLAGVGQGLRHFGKKRREVLGLALVLVVAAGLDALGLGVFAVEHHHMGFGLVHPDNGVKSAHESAFLK